MRDVVDRLLTSGSTDTSELLSQTGWRDDSTDEELQALYRDYDARYADALRELVMLLGEPQKRRPSDAAWFGSWYPEAFAAAAWSSNGKWICLAAEHADRETPVILQLRCLTERALAELAS